MPTEEGGSVKKSPLGVVLRGVWLENRMRELARAIYEQLSQEETGRILPRQIAAWSQELSAIAAEWEELSKRKG